MIYMVKYDGYTRFMIFKIISIRVDLLFSVGFKMYAQVPLPAQPLCTGVLSPSLSPI